jgi:hypothetical protein
MGLLSENVETSLRCAHDNRLAAKLLSRQRRGSMLLADRGYDALTGSAQLSARTAPGANITPK